MFSFVRSLFQAGSSRRFANDVRTSFLYVEPSIVAGVGRVIDLWGGFDLFTMSHSGEAADARALFADWRMIGQDIRDTMPRAVRELTR